MVARLSNLEPGVPYYREIHRHNRERNSSLLSRLAGPKAKLLSLLVGGALTAHYLGHAEKPSLTAAHPQEISEATERVGLRPANLQSTTPGVTSQFQSRLPFEPRVARGELLSATGRDALLAAAEQGWKIVTVGRGDNLSLVFNRIGANRNDLHALVNADKRTRTALTSLTPGQVIRIFDHKGHIKEFVLEVDYLTSLKLTREGQKFKPEWVKSTPEIRVATASAEINHSLFIDGQKAGLQDKTIMEFVNVFGWDVDFLRELQRGDKFSVVFEEIYKDGEKITSGKILAAEFVTGGRRLRAILFENSNGTSGYYTEKGEGMRKAFLRTPVNFTRISSRFSLARRHPILNRIRAHKGVDYSAPTGTPVQSVADGKVEFVGWRGGYGKVIVLKHANRYSTLYGHLSKFAANTRRGAAVSQGQTIGYVGRTGLATGPHLHYEFLVNGVHHDPLKVKLPNSLPLDRSQMQAFNEQATEMLAKLDAINREDSDHAERTAVATLESERQVKSR